MPSKIIPDSTKIRVVGYDDIEYEYGKIKNTVVRIGDHFYFRHDEERVVRVKDEKTGKMRFYRITSPLVVKTEDNRYILKTNAYLTEDKIWLDINSPNTIKIREKYYRKSFCTRIGHSYYLLTDPKIFRCKKTGEYGLVDQSVKLSEKFYGKNALMLKELGTLTTTEGEIVYKGDAVGIYNCTTDKIDYYHASEGAVRSNPRVTIVTDFIDKTNPQEERLLSQTIFATDAKNCVEFEFYPGSNKILIPKSKLEYFSKATADFIMPKFLTTIELVRAKVNKNFGDLDASENTAKVFKHLKNNWGGKVEIHRPESHSIPVVGRSFSNMGGLKYSFGVEFETAQGVVPTKLLDATGLFAVGDRSISAAEYVTPPMSGNKGFERLKEMCDALNQYTLVDDRCSIHVHVGGLTNETAPSFNKQFILNSIKLGALIEHELYAAMPPARNPFLYHCHSIKRFEGITKENFDDYVGAYIFGPKELWVDPDTGELCKLFKFSDYKLNDSRNRQAKLDTWAKGRYKWLNLIHSFTRSSHQTIEFRIFSPTTNFIKARNYVLTALAFTYVCDNLSKIIRPGVTLEEIFTEVYPAEIAAELIGFYNTRKLKFKRGDVYSHPKFKLNLLTQ